MNTQLFNVENTGGHAAPTGPASGRPHCILLLPLPSSLPCLDRGLTIVTLALGMPPRQWSHHPCPAPRYHSRLMPPCRRRQRLALASPSLQSCRHFNCGYATSPLATPLVATPRSTHRSRPAAHSPPPPRGHHTPHNSPLAAPLLPPWGSLAATAPWPPLHCRLVVPLPQPHCGPHAPHCHTAATHMLPLVPVGLVALTWVCY